MKYLVVGSEGPGFGSPQEAVTILEGAVLPSFDQLIKLEKGRKILAGGLPVGERALVFIVDAASHEELDQLLEEIPLWGMLNWEVTPLQSFAGRRTHERDLVKKLKEAL